MKPPLRLPRSATLSPRRGVVDLMGALEVAGVAPDAPLLVEGGNDPVTASLHLGPLLTRHQLEARVTRRADALSSGVGPGAIHPLVLRPDAEGVVELLAIWRLGAVPAPLNPKLTEAERAAAVEALSGRAVPGAQVVLWTSGTSGSPRGVALGWDGIAGHVEMVVDRLSLRPGRDVWLASLSPAHVGGFMLVARALLLGGVLVAAGIPSPEDLVRVLEGSVEDGADRPVSHLSLVPTQLRRLLEEWGDRPAPEELRCVLLGGARTPTALLEKARAGGWPVSVTWGMTEMASQVATAPPEEVARHPGTVGRPLPGVEVRRGEDGELLVRSPAAALGYVDGRSLPDRDGWYSTGDVGRVEADGRVRITGRRADRIVTGGVTVEAAEVEEVVRAHPAVADVCVVGLPDEEWGERVAAWVVPVEGEFERDAVDVWTRERLASAKRPRVWHRGGDLPRNVNGKVDRGRVRDLLSGQARG